MNKTWSVRELSQIELSGGLIGMTELERFHQLWKEVPQNSQNQKYYYKLRVCSTWYTLYSLMSEMSLDEQQYLERFLRESVFLNEVM